MVVSAPIATYQEIRRDILDRLYPQDPYRYGSVGNAAVTTTTLTDAKLVSAMLNPQRYIGAWIYIFGTVAAVATSQVSRITQYDNANGKFTFSPAITDVDSGTAYYEIHYGLHPDEVEIAVNRTLNQLTVEEWGVLTDFYDGNMQESDTGFWTALGACVPAKALNSTVPYRDLVGRQVLELGQLLVANDGVETLPVRVYPARPALVVLGFDAENTAATASTLTLTVRKGTDSSVLKTETLSLYNDTVGPPRPTFEARIPVDNIPSTLDAIKVRLVISTVGTGGSLSGCTVALNYLAVLPMDTKRFRLPAAVESPENILGVYKSPQGLVVGSGRIFQQQTTELVPVGYGLPRQHTRSRWGDITLREQAIDSPFFVKYTARLPVFTAYTDSTVGDKDVVVLGAIAQLEKSRGDIRAAAEAAHLYKELVKRRMGVQPVRVVETPAPRVYIA